MTTEVTYRVKTKFKYLGQMLNPGDEFRPAGGKFDELILRSETLVARMDIVREAEQAAAAVTAGEVQTPKRKGKQHG